ncbi:unnamed protein product, partial [Allacma fusca]
PPVGDRRFADPLPPQNWENILDGRKIGPECAQINVWTAEIFTNIVGEEDCLHLNINVPSKVYKDVLNGRRAKVPVIFYIHGGGFITGSGGLHSSAYFMDEDVVTVIINYRLELLGFFTTGDDVIRGNAGLKDQTMALRWVQKNIQYFGGDPNQVTIFGSSAGAVSAHYQMLSPLSKGLLRKVFAQSGSASTSWGFNSLESSLEKAMGIARKLNCSTNDTRRLAKCLRNTPIKDLLMTRLNLKTDWFGLNPQEKETTFGPTSEAIQDERAFITTDPLNIIQEGKAHRVPLMIGHSTHEGLFSSYSFIPVWFQVKFFIWERVFGIPPKYYGIGHGIDTLYFFPAPMTWIYPENKLYWYSKDLVKLVADFSRDDTKMEFRGVEFPAVPKIEIAGKYGTVKCIGKTPSLGIAQTAESIPRRFKKRALKSGEFLRDLNRFWHR